MDVKPVSCSKKKRLCRMHLLHSSIEHFFIVQMQHGLMLRVKRGSLSLAVIIQAALSSSLGSACNSDGTTFLPVSSLKKNRGFCLTGN